MSEVPLKVAELQRDAELQEKMASSLSLSLSLSLSRCLFLAVCLSACLPVCLSACLSLSLSRALSLSVSVPLPVGGFVASSEPRIAILTNSFSGGRAPEGCGAAGEDGEAFAPTSHADAEARRSVLTALTCATLVTGPGFSREAHADAHGGATLQVRPGHPTPYTPLPTPYTLHPTP